MTTVKHKAVKTAKTTKVDKTKFVVFKKKLWFMTDYIVPFTDGQPDDVSSPTAKFKLMLTRRDQNRIYHFEYLDDYFLSDDAIACSLDEIMIMWIKNEYAVCSSKHYGITELWQPNRSYSKR